MGNGDDATDSEQSVIGGAPILCHLLLNFQLQLKDFLSNSITADRRVPVSQSGTRECSTYHVAYKVIIQQ